MICRLLSQAPVCRQFSWRYHIPFLNDFWELITLSYCSLIYFNSCISDQLCNLSDQPKCQTKRARKAQGSPTTQSWSWKNSRKAYSSRRLNTQYLITWKTFVKKSHLTWKRMKSGAGSVHGKKMICLALTIVIKRMQQRSGRRRADALKSDSCLFFTSWKTRSSFLQKSVQTSRDDFIKASTILRKTFVILIGYSSVILGMSSYFARLVLWKNW